MDLKSRTRKLANDISGVSSTIAGLGRQDDDPCECKLLNVNRSSSYLNID
jgi:hypothetical protein